MVMLNKFDEYIKELKESLNSNIEIKWIEKQNRHIGLFQINNNIYQLDFNLKCDSWSYKFYFINNKDNKITLKVNKTDFKYDSFKVLATAKKGLIRFIDKNSPNAVVFSAHNEGNDYPTKRMSIYQQILTSLIDEFPDYNYKIDNISNIQIYIVYKEKLKNVDFTFNNIKEIIEDYIN